MTSLKATTKRAISAPPIKRTALSSKFSANNAGAVSEEMFISSFEDVPRAQIFTSKDMEMEMNKIKEILSDTNVHWEKRMETLKHLRSVVLSGGTEYEKFLQCLKMLEVPLQMCVKDLRSQIVREACITICYLSQKLGNKFERFCELLLQTLINLIPNSAKIMSTSGIVTIRFIIQHTHSARLIPIITYNLSSKSKEIRKYCCEFLLQLLHTWPTHTLEKHIGILQEAIKKGISDADPEARAFSRKAFWGFSSHFKEQADYLLHSLDCNKQRMLFDEQVTMSSSVSSNSLFGPSSSSLNCVPSYVSMKKPVSTSNSVENLARPLSCMSGSLKSRSGIPMYATRVDYASSRTLPSPLRSTSAIDVGAAKRAKARAVLSTVVVQPNVGSSGPSITKTSPKKLDSASTAMSITSPERVSRSKVRVSQSQPNSRSTSPSVRLGYHTLMSEGRGLRVRRRSGIPVSTSREASPTRSLCNYAAMERRLSSGSNRAKAHSVSMEKNFTSGSALLAERMLQQSQEAEVAMADALATDGLPVRRRYNFDDHSDESETSSVCSDRSFGSFGGRNVEDVSDIIRNLSSAHWSDRKEGLLGLQFFLKHSPHSLSVYELKRITDMFTKMLLDPHTKTFTLFLEILNELILVYKQELNGWLYILMTRLFLKMGTDTLGSVQNRIQKTFEIIRESFACQDQFNVIIRFLSDQTQTPNVKVKITVLQYLHNLFEMMDPNDLTANNNHELQLALMKIISWTADPKSQELRKQSNEVIVDLFNLNTPEFSTLLNQLPKSYQDAATLQAPSLLQNYNIGTVNYDEYDNTENLNPKEIYNSIRQTTDEILKLNMDSNLNLNAVEVNKPEGTYKAAVSPTVSPKKDCGSKAFKDISSASQDSGISQVDGVAGNTKSTPSPPATSLHSSPSRINNGRVGSSEGLSISEPLDSYKIIFNDLNSPSKDVEGRKQAINELVDLMRNGDPSDWNKHFREALRILLEKISKDESYVVRCACLKAMCNLLVHEANYFEDFVELTVLRVLDACKDKEKEVQRAAEACAATAASVLPPDQCLRVLKSVITTGEYPLNQSAIKTLHKLVENHDKNTVVQLLPELMPALIQAYDNPESSVRKAAVVCMVAVHNCVEPELKPFLNTLSISKRKLLNLYIERSKSGSSSCSSPVSVKHGECL